MNDKRSMLILLGVVFFTSVASGWISVGADAEPGYAIWTKPVNDNNWSGQTFSYGVNLAWQADPGIFGAYIKPSFGNNQVTVGDSSLSFSHISGAGGIRISPLSFLYAEVGAGLTLLNNMTLQGENLAEFSDTSMARPVVQAGVGFRGRVISNLAFEIGFANTFYLFSYPGVYWNPAARFNLSWDFGREGVRWKFLEVLAARPKADPEALPPHLEMELSFTEPNGNNALDAGETAELLIKLYNAGPGVAKDLTVHVKASGLTPGLDFPPSFKVARLDVEDDKELTVPLVAAENIGTRTDTLFVEVKEPRFHNNVPRTGYAFQVLKHEPPLLDVATDNVAISDDADARRRTYGNGDSRIQAGETVMITAIVENKGEGIARNVRFSLAANTPGVAVLDSTNQLEIGKLYPGYWDTLSFLVNVPTVVRGDSLSFDVTLTEEREKYNSSIVWSLPMNAELPTEVVMAAPVITDTQAAAGGIPRFSSAVDYAERQKGLKENPNAIAVVIGASSYTNKDVANVAYARRDMGAVQEHLMNVLGFAKQNVYSISDPTLSELTTWFGKTEGDVYHSKLYRKTSVIDNPVVFIYYSGHGVSSIKTGEPYLVPINCDPNYPELGGYPLKQLYTNLKMLDTEDVTVVIDACFSGSSPKGSLITEASPLIMEPIDYESYFPSHFTVFSAAGGREVANWLAEEQHGLFTYYFLKGLQGEADDGDKRLTWAELNSYVTGEVSRAAADQDREQRPVFSGDESRTLTTWR